MTAKHECLLILPLGIGADGFARKSDGSRLGRRGARGDIHVNLYRPGYQPLENQH